MLLEDGNRTTRFAGRVSERFEITDVTGMLRGLAVQKSALFSNWWKVHRTKPLTRLEIVFSVTLTAAGLESTFHSPFSTARVTSTFSLCLHIQAPRLGVLCFIDRALSPTSI